MDFGQLKFTNTSRTVNGSPAKKSIQNVKNGSHVAVGREKPALDIPPRSEKVPYKLNEDKDIAVCLILVYHLRKK